MNTWNNQSWDEDYTKECNSCGAEIKVRTQKDDYPEYHTDVKVWCNVCNQGFAEFLLPVN